MVDGIYPDPRFDEVPQNVDPTEWEVEKALHALDPERKYDVLINRYGDLYSVRPLTIRAATWLTEWNAGAEVDPMFGWYSLAVERDDLVDLVDGLHDSGLRVL